jgi:putative hemolysin
MCLAAILVAGCSSGTGAPAGSGASGSGTAASGAEGYCTSKGGQLVTRVATWNTNADPQAWLQLAGKSEFCEFESGSGQNATRISVDLTTLYSQQPTMAAIAYLSKVPPLTPPQPSANPAAYNCTNQLGGAADFGNTATPGGWVDTTQPVFKVMNYCVFADGSAIDEFGILYYATGAVRGADLAPILRYQPNGKLPAMFTRVRN